MKKNMTLLHMGHYFHYIIIAIILNIIMGLFLVNNMGAYYISITFPYMLCTLAMLCFFCNAFESPDAKELLKIIPFSAKKIKQIYHFGIHSLLCLPPLFLFGLLAFHHHKLCYFIVPNQVFVYLFYNIIYKNSKKESNTTLTACMIGAIFQTLLITLELCLIYSEFNISF